MDATFSFCELPHPAEVGTMRTAAHHAILSRKAKRPQRRPRVGPFSREPLKDVEPAVATRGRAMEAPLHRLVGGGCGEGPAAVPHRRALLQRGRWHSRDDRPIARIAARFAPL